MAYDDSAAARRALARAAELGRPNDSITVVNVMPETAVSARIGPPDERLRQLAVLEDARSFLDDRGIEAGTCAPIGDDAARAILATAEEIGADVLVIGRRRKHVSHLLGSTSNSIVRSAKCDVLVVHGGGCEGE